MFGWVDANNAVNAAANVAKTAADATNGFIGKEVASNIIAAVVIFVFLFLFRSVRHAILFTKVEYDFRVRRLSRGDVAGEWDVNWESNRLTIQAKDISNDRIDDLKFEFASGRLEYRQHVFPSDKFERLFDGRVWFKVNSIVRQRDAEKTEYLLRMVIRRSRWSSWG